MHTATSVDLTHQVFRLLAKDDPSIAPVVFHSQRDMLRYELGSAIVDIRLKNPTVELTLEIFASTGPEGKGQWIGIPNEKGPGVQPLPSPLRLECAFNYFPDYVKAKNRFLKSVGIRVPDEE